MKHLKYRLLFPPPPPIDATEFNINGRVAWWREYNRWLCTGQVSSGAVP